MTAPETRDPQWYRDAIFYSLRVRSFYDENGDGVGDLPGGDPAGSRASQSLGILLDVFLIEKALYELGYELDNRPSWLRIPLRGIRSILDARVRVG